MVQLPFKRLVEEYKIAKVRTTIQFKYSKDPKIAGVGIEVYTGKKWKAAKELKITEERLREKENEGVVATGRAGLGFSPLLGSIKLQVKRNNNYCKAKYAKVKKKTEWEKW